MLRCLSRMSVLCLSLLFCAQALPQNTVSPGHIFDAFHDDYDLSGNVALTKIYLNAGKTYFGFHDLTVDGTWLPPQIVAHEGFQAYDVSIDGDQALIVGSHETSRVLHFYSRINGVWQETSNITVPGRATTQSSYVEISHNNAAVLNGITMIFFRKEESQWFPDGEVIIAPQYHSSYVADFSLYEDTLIGVVANRINIFERLEYGWRKEGVLLQAGDVASGYSQSVAVSESAMLVGGVNDSVYYTVDDTGTWTLQQVVPRGGSVALNDTQAVIADYDAAYHFVKNSQGEWQETGNINNGYLSNSGQVIPFFLNGGAHVALNDSVVLYGGHGSLIASDLPIQSSSHCIDTGVIGDGWGWDGTKSCTLPVENNHDRCDYSSAWLNNGWGWNTATQTSCEPRIPACIDTGVIGDGWGWNGTASCQLPVSE